MKVENPPAFLVQWFHHKIQSTLERRRVFMVQVYQIHCPKCNNNHSFYRYGKDKNGFQKYLCRKCGHQFASDAPAGKPGKPRRRSYPSCPVCGKATFLRHDIEHYSNYHCCDKRCNHSFFVPKITAIAPLFQNIAIQLIPALNFNSDEWHADETVVKIQGVKHYLWLIVEAETRFMLGFHLSPHRDSSQAFTLLHSVKALGKPQAIVTDRYNAYKAPVKAFGNVRHIRVQSFGDDITNNLISMFVFFHNFVRPHSALNGLIPAQCTGLKLSKKRKRELLLVA